MEKKVGLEQRIDHMIGSMLKMYHRPYFVKWGNAWLEGTDRSWKSASRTAISAKAVNSNRVGKQRQYLEEEILTTIDYVAEAAAGVAGAKGVVERAEARAGKLYQLNQTRRDVR
jgi:hypothetical protein